jgi:hypothetical protein
VKAIMGNRNDAAAFQGFESDGPVTNKVEGRKIALAAITPIATTSYLFDDRRLSG